MKISTIVGARPQFVKASMVSEAIRHSNGVEEVLIHTGQHYDDNMSGIFFRELNLPTPKYNLGISGGSQISLVSRMIVALEKVMQVERPDIVLIYGDTNSSLAGALTAAKLRIPVVHVEAGERIGNKNNPEELNRVIIDHTASLLLCTTDIARDNLKREGIFDNVYVVGNLMGEGVIKYLSVPWEGRLLRSIAGNDVSIPKFYYLMTCHRQENTAIDNSLREIMSAMESLEHPTIFPVHPRNRERTMRLLTELNCRKIIAVEPVGYFESIHLIAGAMQVVTDSGGVLTEAFACNIPYVFVLELEKIPKHTLYDVSRLASPKHEAIERILKTPFIGRSDDDNSILFAGTANRIVRCIIEKYGI